MRPLFTNCVFKIDSNNNTEVCNERLTVIFLNLTKIYTKTNSYVTQ